MLQILLNMRLALSFPHSVVPLLSSTEKSCNAVGYTASYHGEGAIEPADVSEAEQIIKLQYLCYQRQMRPPVPRVALYYGFVGREITSSALRIAPKPTNRALAPRNTP
jgi:hypothetical protein